MYAIMKRYSINVGRIICETMKRCRIKKMVKSLYFDSTIIQLINIFGNPPAQTLVLFYRQILECRLCVPSAHVLDQIMGQDDDHQVGKNLVHTLTS